MEKGRPHELGYVTRGCSVKLSFTYFVYLHKTSLTLSGEVGCILYFIRQITDFMHYIMFHFLSYFQKIDYNHSLAYCLVIVMLENACAYVGGTCALTLTPCCFRVLLCEGKIRFTGNKNMYPWFEDLSIHKIIWFFFI